MRPLVLGLDPSFNRTGWAALVEGSGGRLVLASCGVFLPKGGTRGQRLLSIQQQCVAVLGALQPLAVAIEEPGTWRRRGGSRRETVEVMAMARGDMLAACAELSVPALEADFRTVRKALLGRGNAPAAQVVGFVCSQGLQLPTRPRGGADIDIANAIVVAMYGLLLVAGRVVQVNCGPGPCEAARK